MLVHRTGVTSQYLNNDCNIFENSVSPHGIITHIVIVVNLQEDYNLSDLIRVINKCFMVSRDGRVNFTLLYVKSEK